MGKFSREKGARDERNLVNWYKHHGVPAMRVPLSGATDYAKADVEAHIFGKNNHPVIHECKSRTKDIKTIRDWLSEDCDVVRFKANNKTPLFIMPESTWLRIIKFIQGKIK